MTNGDSRWWWAAPPRPALLLLGGALLGPNGVNVLRTDALVLVQPLVTLTLATIGALVMLGASKRRLVTEALIVLAVAAALAPAVVATPLPLPLPAALAWRTVAPAAAAILTGLAGILLLARRGSPTEHRVFGLGILLLLAGIADVTGTPALLTGGVAGALWIHVMGHAADGIRKDGEYLQTSLTALLLLVIGAQVMVSTLVCTLAALHLLVTVFIARRSGAGRLVPGVIAIAAAADLDRTVGALAHPVLSAVAISVIAMQLFAALAGTEADVAVSGARA